MPSVSSPRGLKKHNESTVFLRVPLVDWPKVAGGFKTEFRVPGHNVRMSQLEAPTPVVAYAHGQAAKRHQLMVLEATWTMPLGMISDESLEREGFPDLAHFRRYWMDRTKKRFSLLDTVQVFQVRPVGRDEHEALGRMLLRRLYGEYL
jgi:hypothetical protein